MFGEDPCLRGIDLQVVLSSNLAENLKDCIGLLPVGEEHHVIDVARCRHVVRTPLGKLGSEVLENRFPKHMRRPSQRGGLPKECLCWSIGKPVMGQRC